MKLAETTLNPKFSEQLRTANGRRRERIVSFDTVQEFRDQKIDSHESWNGGTVCNSYRYPACMTVVVARVHRGRLYARANVRNAKGTGCGDVIHGNRWVGPTTAAGLRAAQFHYIGDV